MYVCICNAISEQQVKEALDNGAQNLHDLQNTLGVGSQCGCCRDHCRNLVCEYQHKQTESNQDLPILPLSPIIPA